MPAWKVIRAILGAGGGQVYDWTTWKEGMNYPGATQLGIGKKLLEQYPWWRFEPHPEWAPGCSGGGDSRRGAFRVSAAPQHLQLGWSRG